MSKYAIRRARTGDEDAIFGLIRQLAEYEELSDRVDGTAAELGEHLFGDPPACEALIVEVGKHVIGYALFFGTYSTFRTRPGLFLEDLFVHPSHRGKGLGRALLGSVARTAVKRGCARLEWSVLDWNEPAIKFYKALGSVPLEGWTTHRLSGDTLRDLAEVEFG